MPPDTLKPYTHALLHLSTPKRSKIWFCVSFLSSLTLRVEQKTRVEQGDARGRYAILRLLCFYVTCDFVEKKSGLLYKNKQKLCLDTDSFDVRSRKEHIINY